MLYTPEMLNFKKYQKHLQLLHTTNANLFSTAQFDGHNQIIAQAYNLVQPYITNTPVYSVSNTAQNVEVNNYENTDIAKL